MFNETINDLKEYFHDEPLKFLGVIVVLIGLFTFVGLAAYLLTISLGFLVTAFFLCIVTVMIGLALTDM